MDGSDCESDLIATEAPVLQHAETDGSGPRKRRRPALSCVECRKRKVKCDRRRPCGPCTRTRMPTCTYRPDPLLGERLTARETSAIGASAVVVEAIAANPSQSEMAEKNRIIQELTDRLHELESKLSSSAKTQSNSSNDGSQPRASQFVKSKFYGESHWNNVLEPYSALGRSNITVNSNTNRTEVDKTSELYVTVAECKRMARAIKSSRIIQPSIIQEVQAYLPTRDVCDQLLECYFRTFEGIFRVFHIPTFMKEYESYWVNPAMIKSSILLKVLLVCALGVTFYSGPEKPRLRADCAKWLQAAESWLSGPHAKSRFNIAGTQIQILVLLARQICSIDGDLVWVPAGRLLRGAMHLGLHRDPNHIGEMSVFHAEMRRRLWATVMEITVQSSLDFGMPPMISPDDYSTLPPSNFNDEDIYEAERSTLEPKPFTQFTQSSIQIALYETLPLRLEITRLINNLHRSLTYDETLALGNQILARCREKTAFMQSFLSSSRDHAPNVFQIKLFDTLIRRFYLCLHRPYFTLAEQDPRYYYSRKVCLDTSLIIITPTEVPAETEDDWTCLTHRAVGFVKHFFLFSSSTIYLELISQLDPDRDTALPAPLTSAMIPAHRSLSPELQSYYDALQYARSGAEARIRKGEVNAKGYIWLCAALARVDALISRTDADAAVLVAARKAVGHAAGLMKEAYFAEHGEYIDLSQHNPTGGKSYVHGEGADDLTSTPELLNDQLNHAGAGNSAVECGDLGGLDWGRFLQDDGLDLEWGIGVSPDPWLGSGLDCWST